MILVAGGTGTLGRLLVPLLVGRGETVRVMTRDIRRAGTLSGVELLEGDVTRIEAARRAVTGTRVVVSAITGFSSPAGVIGVDVAGNRILAEAAAAAGVEHFVLLSVAQAAANHPIPLFRAKAAAEEALRRSGLSCTIIRPTAYLETWLGLVGGPLVTSGKTMVFGSGSNPINFVSALDVARFVDLAIVDPALSGRIVEVPGPESLTLDDLVEVAEAASGCSGRVTHTPRALLRMLSIGLKPFNRMRAEQIATALAMDTNDMRVDGPTTRAPYPSIPMTTAATVAERLFGAGRDASATRQSSPADSRPRVI